MIVLVRKVIKKIIIERLYKKHVIYNELVRQDIEQTVKVRGCNVEPQTSKRKFNHLMYYYPEFAFIFFWRIKCQKSWTKRFTKDFSCKIFESSDINGGLMCYHPYATVINAKSIGNNFQFRNSLTIGNKGNDNNKLPVIGNNVVVGTNVVIIGDITVGDNVIIGAGSVVIKDVPSNVVVAGNPAKIIQQL